MNDQDPIHITDKSIETDTLTSTQNDISTKKANEELRNRHYYRMKQHQHSRNQQETSNVNSNPTQNDLLATTQVPIQPVSTSLSTVKENNTHIDTILSTPSSTTVPMTTVQPNTIHTTHIDTIKKTMDADANVVINYTIIDEKISDSNGLIGLNSSHSDTTDIDNADADLESNVDGVPDNFALLSYQEVQINLRLLADVKEGEKLMVVDGRHITVDQRYAQSLRRYWTSDSRGRTLRFINHLIIAAKKYCDDAVKKVIADDKKQDNLEKLINIQSLLRSSTTGLGRMAATYSDDKQNLATIETYKSTITVFCDQDLKRAINDK